MDPPLGLSLPTSSWKSLKLRPSALSPAPVHGSGMYMILLVSSRQNIVTNFSNTSIPRTHTSNSPQKTPVRMVPSLSWIPSFPRVLKHLSYLLSYLVYRKPTQKYQYLHMECIHFLPAKYSVYNPLSTLGKFYLGVGPHGPYSDYILGLTIGNTNQLQEANNRKHDKRSNNNNILMVFPHIRGLRKGLKSLATP